LITVFIKDSVSGLAAMNHFSSILNGPFVISVLFREIELKEINKSETGWKMKLFVRTTCI